MLHKPFGRSLVSNIYTIKPVNKTDVTDTDTKTTKRLLTVKEATRNLDLNGSITTSNLANVINPTVDKDDNWKNVKRWEAI